MDGMTKEEALTLWLPVIKMGVKDMPECNEALDMATKALEQRQDPRTGHWVRKTIINRVYDIAGVETWGTEWQCNKCDFTTTVIEDGYFYKYCPNCGIKMDNPLERKE